jgi:hypothetical protein
MKPLPAKPEGSRRAWAVSRSLADRVISLAHLLGCAVRNAAGTRIGRVSDIVVRWDADDEHPPVLLSFGRRMIARRRAWPPPDRVVDWTVLRAFVPGFTHTTTAAGW